ncbi:MAG: alpha-glucosidase C-terminal domain-containing protein [Melioribacteraceae bacterium]|nr:alpha-glucosidase C-terminal domain-containing protein [Melioribacteraceae bacterium]MCF8356778.1 alpha-glucosidase C-terminal domain-containing protein [Melioribacteraceae bacterium]MCF8396150.1 alpha-glucosidase C-terminal domain-containing protein [Melioribacteraceae bacterium]MCF8421112.1 alpha-glucosidase C-terminal domain-containing protein [Melioribacteraceae bacterium]
MKNFNSVVKSLYLLILALLIFGCSQNEKIHDIIEPINLISGVEKVIVVSDMFYADNYDLTILPNRVLSANFDLQTNVLKLVSSPDFEGITILDFKLAGNEYEVPVMVTKIDEFTFSFEPAKEYDLITLFGEFNDWNRSGLEMTDPDGDGTYEITIRLNPGSYQYKFYADGEEFVDESNPVSVSNGMGSFNSVIVIEPRFTETFFLHKDEKDLNKSYSRFSFIFSRDNTKPIDLSNVHAFLDNNKIIQGSIEVNSNKVTVSINKDRLRGEKLLRVVVEQDGFYSNVQYIFIKDGVPVSELDHFTWYDGVIYSLMTDRFNDGDTSNNNPVVHDSLFEKANYMGGDFQGIIDKIEDGYFNSLGVNTLWISPANDNPNEAFKEYPEPHRWFTGYHGYWPIDHQRVEEHFGTMEKLKELVKKAHEHKLKVLLDFVSNHVHEQHPFYKNNPEWFGQLELPDGRLNLRFWDEFRLTTWFEPYMPSFDYEGSPEAVKAMTDNAIWWLKETGADGFRHDAVKHVPNVFWRSLTSKLKKEIEIPGNKKVYQVGETFGSYELVSSYVNNGQLNSQFNFNLYNVAQAVFIDPNESFANLDLDLNKTFSIYGELNLMANIMDSHDKNRFMAYTDGDLTLDQWSAIEIGWNDPPKVDDPKSYKKAELYLAYMNTIPGLPVIYYGSEFGMTGASDPDNRRMMRFDDQLDKYENEMLENVKKIINLRKDHSSLRYGDFFTLAADKNIFAYVRSDFNERIMVVLNKSGKKRKVTFTLPESYTVENVSNLITGEDLSLTGNEIELQVKPLSWNIYHLK